MNSHPTVAAAVELQPLIREHLVAGEERARLAPEVVSAVGQAGLFRLCAPPEVGGQELPPPIQIEVMETISAADPAVAWYMGNSMPACFASASLGENERAELFAEPNRNFGFSGSPAGRAVPDNGGYRLSGQWPVVTGCEDAKWCALTGLVMEGDTPRLLDGNPDGRIFLLRTADIDISPTWQDASAMRGTGSNAVSVNDVFVPEGFTYTPAKPLVIDRPIYHAPLGLLFFPGFAAVACGVLAAALQRATDDLSTKVASYTGQTMRDQAPIQELIANSNAALQAVRLGVREATAAMWEVARTGEEIPPHLKANTYAATFFAVETVRETIGRLFARGSRSAFFQGHPVERALRNLRFCRKFQI